MTQKCIFSNFWGQTSAGGGGGKTSLGPKMGTSVGWGIDKIFAGWGGPPVPPAKNPWTGQIVHTGFRTNG